MGHFGLRILAVVTGMLLVTMPATAQRSSGEPQPKPMEDMNSRLGLDQYPLAAQRAGEQGRVKTRLAIDARGIVTGCVIVQSASPSLDEATCKAFENGAQMFEPARDKRGNVIASQYEYSVDWKLSDGRSMTPTASRFDVTVEADGSVSRCDVSALPRGTIYGGEELCEDMAAGMRLVVTKRNGSATPRFRVLMSRDIVFGDDILPSGEWPTDVIKHWFWHADFEVDATGHAVNCIVFPDIGVVDAETVATPCRPDVVYQRDGDGPVKGRQLYRLGYQILPPTDRNQPPSPR